MPEIPQATSLASTRFIPTRICAVVKRMADSGERGWAFDDPMRVAVEALRLRPDQKTPVLQQIRSTSSRQVFRWKHGKNVTIIVVIRPYWLSFFAKGNAVAWVSATVKETECP